MTRNARGRLRLAGGASLLVVACGLSVSSVRTLSAADEHNDQDAARHTALVPQPMAEHASRLCDFDLDGDCDADDVASFDTHLGACRGQTSQASYHPLADIDSDGCVTETDRGYLFPPDDQSLREQAVER